MSAWLVDPCNLESTDKRTLEIANNTLTASLRGKPGPETPIGLLSKIAMAAATLGRTDDVLFLIPNQMRGLPGSRTTASRASANLANRMSLREGAQALDAQAFGRASEALHISLMQSNPPGPAEAPVIRLFPAWPNGWEAAFTLLARGAFLVTSSIRGGTVEFVELESLAGADCRLRNPWGDSEVTLYRDQRRPRHYEAQCSCFQPAQASGSSLCRRVTSRSPIGARSLPKVPAPLQSGPPRPRP
jgi:hypothetical protein